MQREKKDKHFIHKPVYPGGRQAMKKFIAEQLTYPEEARAEQIKGTVTIDYTIDYKGNVIDAKVISGLGYGCDEEAVRVVKLLQFNVPKQRARRIQFHKTINIHFRPPAERKTPQEARQTVQYHVTTKPKQEEGKKDKGGEGYTYTVNF